MTIDALLDAETQVVMNEVFLDLGLGPPCSSDTVVIQLFSKLMLVLLAVTVAGVINYGSPCALQCR